MEGAIWTNPRSSGSHLILWCTKYTLTSNQTGNLKLDNVNHVNHFPVLSEETKAATGTVTKQGTLGVATFVKNILCDPGGSSIDSSVEQKNPPCAIIHVKLMVTQSAFLTWS